MYLDLIDTLRCPRPHPPTWLVAAALEVRGRVMVRGTLGCPVCRAEFAIDDGVAVFDADGPAPAPALGGPPEELAMRLAALLGLTEPGGIVAVGGAWEPALEPLLDLPEARVVVLEPPRGFRAREPLGV
ncbi:hypothetical protein, partial [Roseisolibacter sp. H3M3-2]|uniref:hypothetical protein n=1 Tax=Roseisolibacter sp. H3M3-2 TaxID=3031323 RepID=UPI0023D985E9